MKKDYTHISMVLDRSGSMGSIASDAIGGFNKFLNDQKQLSGEASLSLIQFDTMYEVVHFFKPIKDVPELTSETFIPRGTTALRDAIGRAINETGARLDSIKEEDRPEKVIVVVITDGYENASKQFSAQEINQMISHQESKYNWVFTFIGANQDAITSARDLGINAQAALTYSANARGVSNSYDALSMSVGNLRRGLTKTLTYSPEDRKKAI